MATFEYTVHDKGGKITSGKIEGDTKENIAQILINQGTTPVVITKISKDSVFEKFKSFGLVPAGEKVLFAEELATLINAGVPIAQALSILGKQTSNKKLKRVIEALTKDVESGLSLSTAMEKHPEVFAPVFVNMTRAGEVGGTMDEALNKLAEQLAKDHELVAKIRGAMIYPAVILVAMTGAMIYMMLTIVPQLQKMFEDLGGKLPLTTRSLIWISAALTKYLVVTIIVIVFIVLAFRWAKKNIFAFNLLIHKFLLKIPVFGKLIKKVNIAHFARTLGSLLSSGVNVQDALNIVADSTTNLVFKEAIEKTAQKVQNGQTIAENIKNYSVFPALVSQMVAVGEETGSLDSILEKVANFYDREVDNITKNLTVLLEPMIMVFIGILVGYMIISIITPIYTMTNMF
ncbi:MAG: type II secretion system F family protein [Patescibacteria group bacterium]|jgi:type IV pilus assembly protein PilC|nr:type II secretion system F family protein [Patescibacteria group bacterium]